jgi:DNA-directed RNA polymerase alpha subunit
MPGDDHAAPLPRGLSAPALRGLAAAGLVDLDRLAEVTESDVLRLHGVGQKAVAVLRVALAERGLAFRS